MAPKRALMLPVVRQTMVMTRSMLVNLMIVLRGQTLKTLDFCWPIHIRPKRTALCGNRNLTSVRCRSFKRRATGVPSCGFVAQPRDIATEMIVMDESITLRVALGGAGERH
jgi:hypothetical protein